MEEILNLLKEPLTIEELSSISGKELDELKEILKKLKDENLIYKQNKKYHNVTLLKEGVIDIKERGFGFIKCEDVEYYVDKIHTSNALSNDIVYFDILQSSYGQLKEAIVRSIKKRNTKTLVCRVTKNKLICDDLRIKMPLEAKNKEDYVSGHKVLFEIEKYGKTKFSGKIIKTLGHVNDPGVDILSKVYKYGVNYEFNEDVLEEAQKYGQEVNKLDLENRVDLTNELIITIDGESAKDLDDAVSLKKLENGNYKLGVHIADVSNYVTENSKLNEEAYERGTSIYLADRVIPMLPHVLSNGICSLNEGVIRLTISCEMEIDQFGEVIDYKIFPSFIKSKHRMTYTDVNKILDNDIEVVNKYQDIYDLVFDMDELREILKFRRLKRGAIEFDDREVELKVDENGKCIDVFIRNRKNAERLIEEFMLVANETVAYAISQIELPFIYRIHELPDKNKLQKIFIILKNLGYKFKFNLNNVRSSDLQSVLRKIKGIDEEKAINALLLRSMAKAKYSDECSGHYGLAAKYYTHFTSPIRRYPDLIVHRLLRKYLFNLEMDIETLLPIQSKVYDIAQQASKTERVAVDLEREVTDMKMAEFMENKIGKTFLGTVSSVTNYGFYVELENGVEGIIRLASLRDYYYFDEINLRLIPERGHKIITIGKKLKVTVVSASKESGEIEFKI